MIDIQAAIESKGLSARKVGAEVRERWVKKTRRHDLPTGPSIGAKLSLLTDGDATWWTGHPDALGFLAEVIGCRVDELLPDDATRKDAIAFAEFEELRPLLPGQDPCAVGSGETWLGAVADAAILSGVPTWIVAPAGSGKSLVVRVLRQRHGSRIRCVTVRRLADAAREGRTLGPLVVEVEVADPDTDAAAAMELSQRSSNTCVLSPFTRPDVGAFEDQWSDVSWRMEVDWRERVIRWAQARTPDPKKIDPQDVLEWLDVIDSTATLFATPGHLLPLLARAYRSKLPGANAPLRDLAREHLGQRLGASPNPWVRHCGVEAIEGLVTERLRRLEVQFTPLPPVAWAELLPEGVVPTSTPVRPTPKGTRRSARTQAAEVTTQPPALQAVAMLVDAGVLETATKGGLDFAPWIRIGIERSAVAKMVRDGDPQWPLLSVDASRAPTIDDALDHLSPAALAHGAEKLRGSDEAEFTTVAGVEALFAALGRRMLTSEWEPAASQMPTLQWLGRRQVEQMQWLEKLGAGTRLTPLTRQRPDLGNAAVLEWLGAAWTFSLAVKAPPEMPKDPGWTMPGWSKSLRLSDAPPNLPPFADGSLRDVFAEHRLLPVARRLVRKCKDAGVPDVRVNVLLPWVVIDGHEHGWALDDSHGHLFIQSRLGDVVGRLCALEPVEVQERVAAVAWRAALQEQGQNPLYALTRVADAAPYLHILIRDHLDAGEFAATFTEDTFKTPDFGLQVRKVPPRLRRAVMPLVTAYVRAESRNVPHGEAMIPVLGREDVDLLVELVADKYGLGAAAAKRVWGFDRDRALKEARAAVTRGDESQAYAWFYSSPHEVLAALLDVLEVEKASKRRWALKWLVATLPAAAAQGPRLHAMLHAAAMTNS